MSPSGSCGHHGYCPGARSMCLKFPGHESDPAKLLREGRRSHPAVQLRQRAMETPRQPDALAEGRLDAALIRPRPSYAAGVAARVIHREALWVAFAADYPLARSDTLQLADLGNQPFIVPQVAESSGFRSRLERLAAGAGSRSRSSMTAAIS